MLVRDYCLVDRDSRLKAVSALRDGGSGYEIQRRQILPYSLGKMKRFRPEDLYSRDKDNTTLPV